MFNYVLMATAVQQATDILWKGMVAMIIVVAVLVTIMYVFKFTDKKRAENKKKKEEEKALEENNKPE